ncbi:MAG: aminoglycoside phosphotransferase family protein [Nitrospirae bacterium]|nr:aminoglycoside phosphotransferase family protein [Candidatus Manganitrophaceae bacterium]
MASQTFKNIISKSGTQVPQFYSEKQKAAYTRVTTRLAQESERYFGECVPPVFSIVRIFRRPFSDIIQCVVQFDQKSFGVYIKFPLVKENVEGEYERIHKNTKREVEVTKEFSSFFSNERAVSVPDVIAFFPDELVIVTKEKEGVPLMSLIAQTGKGKPGSEKLDLLKHACFQVGKALKVFQKMPVLNMGKDELPSNLISYVDLRLRLLLEHGFIQMKERLNVVNYLEKQLEKTDGQTLNLCSVHGDFALGNILISGDQVVFLDLGMYRQGPPSFDFAYFHQHLDDLITNPFFLGTTITHLQDAFLKGYSENFIRESPLFLSYYVRNMVNQLLDLSRTDRLSPIKKIYQKWQYRQYLSNLKKVIQKN